MYSVTMFIAITLFIVGQFLAALSLALLLVFYVILDHFNFLPRHFWPNVRLELQRMEQRLYALRQFDPIHNEAMNRLAWKEALRLHEEKTGYIPTAVAQTWDEHVERMKAQNGVDSFERKSEIPSDADSLEKDNCLDDTTADLASNLILGEQTCESVTVTDISPMSECEATSILEFPPRLPFDKLISTAETHNEVNEPNHDLVDETKNCGIRNQRKKKFPYTRVKKHGRAQQQRRKTTQPVIVVAVISDGQFENQNCKLFILSSKDIPTNISCDDNIENSVMMDDSGLAETNTFSYTNSCSTPRKHEQQIQLGQDTKKLIMEKVRKHLPNFKAEELSLDNVEVIRSYEKNSNTKTSSQANLSTSATSSSAENSDKKPIESERINKVTQTPDLHVTSPPSVTHTASVPSQSSAGNESNDNILPETAEFNAVYERMKERLRKFRRAMH